MLKPHRKKSCTLSAVMDYLPAYGIARDAETLMHQILQCYHEAWQIPCFRRGLDV